MPDSSFKVGVEVLDRRTYRRQRLAVGLANRRRYCLFPVRPRYM